MIYLVFILLWGSMILSVYVIQKDRKSSESRMRIRIDELEKEIRILRNADPSGVKMKKINNAAATLLTAIQEKENDINFLLEKVSEVAEEHRDYNRVVSGKSNYKDEKIYPPYEDSSDLSFAERHMMEQMQGRHR